jgi:hypothetical protein
MTGIFIIRQRYACHLLTDGAAVDPDGRVAAILSKTMALPHLGVAAALRGSVQMLTQLPLLGCVPDLATLRDRADGAVRAVNGEAEVYIAGLDACFAVTGRGVQEIEGFVVVPSSNAISAELDFLHSRRPDEVDPDVDGRRVMRVLRRHPVKYPNGGCGVGGFIQCTTVKRGEITTRVLHRWSDRVGAPLL